MTKEESVEIKKSIALLTTILPVIKQKQIPEKHAKILKEVIANLQDLITVKKEKIDKISKQKSAMKFANDYREFVEGLLRLIEKRDLYGAIFLQSSEDEPNKRNSIFCGNMNEERMFQAIEGIFVQFGPQTLFDFLHWMAERLNMNFGIAYPVKTVPSKKMNIENMSVEELVELKTMLEKQFSDDEDTSELIKKIDLHIKSRTN